MKKILVVLSCLALWLMSSVAFAALDDTRATIASQYGEYRLVIDTDNQLWTKADWETKGVQRAKAASYVHIFSRQGLRFQMEVSYDSDNADANIRAMRFTPDMPIQIKEFKQYFPEMMKMINHPKAYPFATYNSLSRQFQELQSPVRMGIVVRELAEPKRGTPYYPLLAFNVQDEGRLLKQIEYLNQDIYIREFTLERASRTLVHDNVDSNKPAWVSVKNYF